MGAERCAGCAVRDVAQLFLCCVAGEEVAGSFTFTFRIEDARAFVKVVCDKQVVGTVEVTLALPYAH